LRAGFALWSGSLVAADDYTHIWLNHTWIDMTAWLPFLDNCHRGLIPYVDFRREYPIGAGVIYCGIGKVMTTVAWRSEILVLHGLFITLFEAINTVLLFTILKPYGEKRAFYITLLYLLLPTAVILSTVRFETVLVTSILGGIYFHRQNRPYLAAVCWSVGCLLKWVPAFFVVAQEYRAFFVERRRDQWWRSGLILGSIIVLGNLPFVILGWHYHQDISNWWATYAFHMARPLYWDTLLGVWTLWIGEVPFETYAPYWTLALVVIAMLIQPRLSIEARCALICIAMVVLNRVYSPQFNLWFYPFLCVLLAGRTGRGALLLVALLVTLDVVNTLVYPFSFSSAYAELGGTFGAQLASERGGGWSILFSISIVVRTLILAALAWYLLKLPDESIQPRST
jgi:hypothetical protein